MTFFESGTRDTSWKTSHDPFSRLRLEERRRRTVKGAVVAGLVVAVLAGVVAFIGPDRLSALAPPLLQTGPPAAEVVAIADKAFLTEAGRTLLYASRPRVAELDEIAELCDRADDPVPPTGCFHSVQGIAFHVPADPRVADSAVTVLAHELLHAAYLELGAGELPTVDELLHAQIALVPPDDPVHAQIEGSVGGDERGRATELFAYLGTQVMPEGGFAPELEAVYARYFTDRAGLVAVHDRVEGAIGTVYAEAVAASDALAATESANATERARLDADRGTHEALRAEYNLDVAEYNAIPESERGRWTATWTSGDGASFSGPLGDVLAERLAWLEARRTTIESRQSALDAAESAAQTRRAEVEAQLADLTRLLEAAYPGQGDG